VCPFPRSRIPLNWTGKTALPEVESAVADALITSFEPKEVSDRLAPFSIVRPVPEIDQVRARSSVSAGRIPVLTEVPINRRDEKIAASPRGRGLSISTTYVGLAIGFDGPTAV
jgi:hypothetical protein